MNPISITIKNYKSYGDNETEVEFENNTIKLIVGNSGSGKTAIIDAILWNLYGKSLCNIDEVVNRNTKKNCKVDFTFKIGSDVFSIIRYRKHDEYGNKLLIFKNNKNISPTKITDAQYMIQDIVGMTYESMSSSVILSSELYSPFLREKETARLKILEGILSLKVVNKWNDALKKIKKPYDDKINDLNTKGQNLHFGIQTIDNNIKTYKDESVKTLNKLKKEKEELEQKIVDYKNEMNELSNLNIERELEKNKNFKTVFENNKKINEKIEDERKKIYDIDSMLLELSNKKNELEKIDKIDPETYIQEIEEYRVKKQAYENAKAKIDSLKSTIKNKDYLINEQKNNLSKINKIIKEKESIEHDLICPTCKQQITEEINKNLNLLGQREETLKTLKERNIEIDKEVEKIEENNNIVLQQISDLSNNIEIVEEKTFEYSPEQLKEINKRKNSLKNEISIMENDIIQKEKWNKDINERINAEKKNLLNEDGVERSKYSDEYLLESGDKEAVLKEKIKECENDIKSKNQQAQSIYSKGYIDELNSKKKKLQDALKKINDQIGQNEYINKHQNFLSKLFSNKEFSIKKKMVEKIINEFNKKVNHYVPIFFDSNIYIKFDKNLSETITIDGQEVGFNTFSSGEKTRFEFAVAFSLFMMVKSFFSSNVNFIIFDEILDINLDEESLEKVLGVVNSLGENNSIIIISHKTELKDRFTNHIVVSKDKNGYSKFVEAA